MGRLVPVSMETRVYPHNKEKDADDDDEGKSKEYKFMSNWL